VGFTQELLACFSYSSKSVEWRYAKLHMTNAPSIDKIKQIWQKKKFQRGGIEMSIAIAVLTFIGGVAPLVTQLLKSIYVVYRF
jgi:hypothetical protein